MVPQGRPEVIRCRTLTEYAALLRGVSPVNASMSDLVKAFERDGFTNAPTVLGSGNVLFSAPGAPEPTVPKAMAFHSMHTGRTASP